MFFFFFFKQRAACEVACWLVGWEMGIRDRVLSGSQWQSLPEVPAATATDCRTVPVPPRFRSVSEWRRPGAVSYIHLTLPQNRKV